MDNLWNLWHEASLASSGCYQRLEAPQAAVPSTRAERLSAWSGQVVSPSTYPTQRAPASNQHARITPVA